MSLNHYRVRCSFCGGHGIREGFGGGPVECHECKGAGGYYVMRGDVIVLWPGGPMNGRAPGLWREAIAAHARRIPQ
jgi:hypothetical protein